MELGSESRTRWMLGLVGGSAFATLLALEVATEERSFSVMKMVLEALELALTVAAAAGFTLLAGRLRTSHEEKLALIRDLEVARIDGEGWRRQVQHHVQGLGAAIERQFQAWGLTEAEAEVALLLIKGYSHKEIAALRRTSEATVRQQARAGYEKSGLKGRAAFSAYFLEDLLPSPNAGSPTASIRPSLSDSVASRTP